MKEELEVRKFYNVNFGIQPINWVNDDLPEWGKDVHFSKVMDEIHEAGFQGCEKVNKFPSDPKVLKDELKKRNLVLSSGWGSTCFISKEHSEEFFEDYKKHVLFLKEMGSRYVVTCELGNSQHWDPRGDRTKEGVKEMNDEEWSLLAEGLNRAGEFCNQHGMALVYHVHAGTVIENHKQVKRLMDSTDHDKVHLLFDTGHLYFCGVDVVNYLEEFIDRVKYVHLKDVRKDILEQVNKHGLDFRSAVKVGVFTVPGDGDVDFETLMDILEKNYYQGWMVVEAEQNPKHANPFEYAKKARAYIAKLTNM
jgi:inosose dehydratase